MWVPQPGLRPGLEEGRTGKGGGTAVRPVARGGDG